MDMCYLFSRRYLIVEFIRDGKYLYGALLIEFIVGMNLFYRRRKNLFNCNRLVSGSVGFWKMFW